jgi:hypothetical protein
MPRRPRVFADGAIYHVYARFGRGVQVFAEGEGAKHFVAIVADVKRTDGLTVLAWCRRARAERVDGRRTPRLHEP